MSPDVFQFLPENWTGVVAVVLFVVYVGAQIIEKFEPLAKFFPGGKWWHNRQKQRRGRRRDIVADDNEIIMDLQQQVSSIVGELAAVRETLRAFTAWSVYDARWHHQALVDAAVSGCVLPEHLDYFAFEKLWRADPLTASKLPGRQ